MRTLTKYLCMAFLAVVASTASVADTLKYRDDIKVKHFNSVWKSQYDSSLVIRYQREADGFDFYIEEPLGVAGFNLTRKEADSLMDAIEKYREWNLKASRERVELEKDIDTVLSDKTFWKFGDEEWDFGNGAELTVSFFSQNTKKHQLVISSTRFRSIYDDYSVHKPQVMYFDYSASNWGQMKNSA